MYDPAERARKALQGPGVVGSYSSGVRVVDWCTRGGGNEVNSQEYVPGPNPCIPGPIYTLNVPSFLIDTCLDEVLPDWYLCFTEFSTCFTEFRTGITLHPG